MKKKLLILFGLLSLIYSCKEKKEEVFQQVKEIKQNIDSAKNATKKLSKVKYFVNDSLLKTLKDDLVKISLNNNLKLKIKPVTNKYNKTIIDTVKTLYYNKTMIYSYRAINFEKIYKAKINSSKFYFSNSLKIGSKKEVLENILKKEIEADIIEIGNLEQTSVFNFKYKKNILNSITFNNYID